MVQFYKKMTRHMQLHKKQSRGVEMRKNIGKKLIQKYCIQGLSGMALGLFATLIVGLIMKQIGALFGSNGIGTIFVQLGSIASVATGVGIGVAVAHALEAPKLVLYASAVTGFVGAYAGNLVAGTMIVEGNVVLSGPGDPLGAFLAAVVGIELGRLIAGKTKLDIVLTPIVTILTGGAVGLLIGPPISQGMLALGNFIMWATEQQPFIMGIIISTVMGMLLTLPISSAAISIIFGLGGLAAGAATVGCSTQMIGFAVASYRENKINGLVAQGIGTSMLQVPNIVRNPRIWIPPILASAILGPLSTMDVFHMTNNPAGGGMGTAGFVGQFMTWQTMIPDSDPMVLFIKILLLHFILPAILTLGISEFMRKKGWIQEGDMKLSV